jgi:Calpain family cysteine protease
MNRFYHGVTYGGETAMTTETHQHHLQDAEDNGLFVLVDNDYISAGDTDDDYAQAPATNFASSAAAARVAAVPIPTQTLYLTEPGTISPISVSDINQGQLGDCFLLSSIGEEALFHPSAITNMIHNNGNGTETVTLYTASNGSLPTFSTTSFKATTVTINNVFSSESVNSGAQQDVVGNQKEIRPQVLEKAVATLDGGYNAIANGGTSLVAMEELTGQATSYMTPASLTLATLQNFVAAGDLIVMDTSSRSGLPYGLFGDHAYMFDKLTGTGSSAAVQLLNPWGFDQPAAIPLTKLASSGIVEIDIGHTG